MEPVHVKSVKNFRMHSWLVIEKLPLIFFWFPFQETLHGQGQMEVGGVGIIIIRRLVFIFFFCFFVNRFFCLFVQFFTIIIIKCKASFSCHSSSSHYSTQGFILTLFHFIFSFLKINKQFYMWPSVFFLDIRIKKYGQACRKNITKNSQANGSLRENVSVFSSHLF